MNASGTSVAPRAGSSVSRWCRIGVSAVLLLGLLGYIDLGEAVRVLRHADPGLLALALLTSVAQLCLSSYRWYMLLHGKHEAVTFGSVLRINFTSSFVGFFMPGGMGIEVVRIYSLSRATADVALSISSVLVERVLALLTLFSLVLLALLLSPPGLPPSIGYAAWFGLALLGLFSVTLMARRARRATARLLGAVRLRRINAGMARLYACLDAYRKQPGMMAWAIAVAIGYQFMRIALVIFCAWALRQHLPLVYFILFVPIIIVLTLLPISIAGLGVREGAFVYLFGLVGMRPEDAFMLSVLVFLMNIAGTLPGAWFYATDKAARPGTAGKT